jgi:alpha-tubulin suppressor-like RCC1 family protein
MRANARIISLRAAAGTALLASLVAVHPAAARQEPLTTAFTYQGELAAAGLPATGTFDLQFRLFDAAGAGAQIGSTLCSDDLVVENGRFTVTLDFGPALAGQRGFLEIQVRQDAGQDCSDDAGFSPLSPRQELTASPNAGFALAAGSAALAENSLKVGGQPAANIATLSGNQTFTGTLNFSNPGNVFTGNFVGDGAFLSNLNGGNLQAGTVTRSRVGSDVESVLSQWSPANGSMAQATRADAIAYGLNNQGQTNVPALPPGLTYVAAAAGENHCIALRSNGTIVGWGNGFYNQLIAPALPPGMTYTAVVARGNYSLALRSDGNIVGFGSESLTFNGPGFGQLAIPALPPGVVYTSMSGADSSCLAVRSDGTAVGWGSNTSGQLNLPTLDGGRTFTAVSAGLFHSLALLSDGSVAAFGRSNEGQLSVPALPPGVTYTAISAGGLHSVALRSDGQVVGWGYAVYGQTAPPALPAGMTYTAIAAGLHYTLCLRSDGVVVGFGENQWGQSAGPIPALPLGTVYSGLAAARNHSVLLRSTVPLAATSNMGVVIGTSAKPVSGGLSVGGAASFTGGLTASTLAGSGAGLTNLNASNIVNGTIGSTLLSGTYSSELTLSNAGNVLAGNGSAITGISASNIASGTLAETRLPSSVARTNSENAFNTSINTFAGQVGIGTSAPSSLLDVVGYYRTGAATAVDQQQTVQNSFGSGTDVWQSFTAGQSGQLTRVEFNGASGIGGQSRVATLQVYSGEGTTGPLLGSSSITLIDDGAGAWVSSTIPGQVVVVAGRRYTVRLVATGSNFFLSASDANSYPGGRTNGPDFRDYMFRTYVTGAASTPMLSVGINGVGIGTSDPTNMLTVAGTSKVTGSMSIGANLGIGVAAPTAPIEVRGGTFPTTLRVVPGTLQGVSTANAVTLDIPGTGTLSVWDNLQVSNNTTLGGLLDVAGKLRVGQGVITNGTGLVNTVDLGLYSQTTGNWIRFVTNNAPFMWFTEPGPDGIGATSRMTLTSTGLTVSGSLAKAGGSFKIDHPLDPKNKILYHSFVESPDMMNIYNGEVTTDDNGYAVITMPDYFEALNRDFRYQLTVIDDADQPEVVVWAKVVRRIGADGSNRFSIRSSRGNTIVSWQVTGIRHDAWAEKNRIPNSVDKVGDEKGKYLHPDAFNEPAGAAAQQNPAAASH